MTAKNNPLIRLGTLGQSLWLDYIRRDLITSGELRRMIEKDGLRGMTSNPSIFAKAIIDSHEYDADITRMALGGMNAPSIYEAVSRRDVQMAADEFRSVYDETNGNDGYVSLEVNPHLAHDTQGTITEARRLWSALDRRNVLIKIPATIEGLPAVTQLVSEGININCTLIFGIPRYQQVAEAYIAGIEARLAGGWEVTHVASVASFFLSRIDTLVDTLVDPIIAAGGKRSDIASQVLGDTAIASAKMAYQVFLELFMSKRFRTLEEKGARIQRLLWASTAAKNAEYSDIKYIDALIGNDTVNTAPLETLDAYRDHGLPGVRLEKNIEKARWLFEQLPKLGIAIDSVTHQLETEGVEKFTMPYDALMDTIDSIRSSKPV